MEEAAGGLGNAIMQILMEESKMKAKEEQVQQDGSDKRSRKHL